MINQYGETPGRYGYIRIPPSKIQANPPLIMIYEMNISSHPFYHAADFQYKMTGKTNPVQPILGSNSGSNSGSLKYKGHNKHLC